MNELLIHKYKPKSIDQLLLSENNKDLLKNFLIKTMYYFMIIKKFNFDFILVRMAYWNLFNAQKSRGSKCKGHYPNL